MFHFDGLFSDGDLFFWIYIGKFSSNHPGNDRIQIQVLCPVCGHHRSVPQNGNVICDLKHLVHLVGYVDDGNPLFLQLLDLAKQLFYLPVRD